MSTSCGWEGIRRVYGSFRLRMNTCAGKTLRSLENTTCHTWALLRWCFTTKRRYIRYMYLCLYLHVYRASYGLHLTVTVMTMTYPNLNATWHEFPPRSNFRGPLNFLKIGWVHSDTVVVFQSKILKECSRSYARIPCRGCN